MTVSRGTLHCQLPSNERKLSIVGHVEWNGAENAVLQPRLSALQRQRMVIDGKFVDKELVSQYQVRQITHTKHTDAALPDAVTWDFRIPLDVDCQPRLAVWVTCFTTIHR